ncbi:murein transglycosylase [Leptolyngbya sp. Heron Island J]|uniref:murein transglycosylase A n=1 Tax=Leptolyngbya sp. Heron Island J TaxID=1385935 RepID=UPI0003B93BC1|nr:MltA domain-containing protein [Leptolyngbya sp. Heron Island J]ESA32339.1 murein transglycosylase [Leptolyngbya sp. Heron Island J]
MAAAVCYPVSAAAVPLVRGNCHVEFVPELCLGYDAQFGQERTRLLQSIDYSLDYLNTDAAVSAYAEYPISSITRERVQRSLVRFRQLVATSHSAQQLQQAVRQEFEFYRSVGNDGQGQVEFTGYFEPTYTASAVPTAEYRYPLYGLPTDLDTWPLPHPTRAELEGTDGLQGENGPLAGLELVWLRDRLEAFLVQVQGSARLQLTDGSVMSVGYAGRTEYPYISIGRALVKDGIVEESELSLPVLLDYFEQQPEALDRYLPQNDRFVFFKATGGSPPIGNLNVPVTAGRSIATDKTLMPPGALALISLELPIPTTADSWQSIPVNRYVLDQDTGGAIRGPGRVDIFVGTGIEAGEQAGLINTSGQLYYLLLRE